MKENFEVISILSRLIAIDTRSSKNNKPLIDLLKTWFKDYSCEIQHWSRKDGVLGENLIVKVPGKKSDQSLIIVGHTDTVPSNENWETDPFVLKEKNGKLYGLGACDTKGGIASMITALHSLQYEKPAYDTYLVFDGDEEVSTAGAMEFLKAFSLLNPHFIFIEPTDKTVAIGMRSIIQIVITTHGIATHSSQATPENNKKHNAIYKMHIIMDALAKDADIYAKDSDAMFGITTQNFGMIQGGTAMNVFADTCNLVMERRLQPQRDLHKEFEHITKIIKSIDKDARIILNKAPSFLVSQENHFAKNVLRFTKETISSTNYGIFPAWSEAGLFADKGDVLVLGPGSLVNQAHRANEYVEKKELLDFVDIYRKIIGKISFANK